MQLQLAAATWRVETRSDSALYKITLLFVTACSASYQLLYRILTLMVDG